MERAARIREADLQRAGRGAEADLRRGDGGAEGHPRGPGRHPAAQGGLQVEEAEKEGIPKREKAEKDENDRNWLYSIY